MAENKITTIFLSKLSRDIRINIYEKLILFESIMKLNKLV